MTDSNRPLVGIVMGSDSDLEIMSEAARVLKKFGVPFEIEVSSAHRSPARTTEYARTAIARGLKVLIVAAGGAAHLGGVIACHPYDPENLQGNHRKDTGHHMRSSPPRRTAKSRVRASEPGVTVSTATVNVRSISPPDAGSPSPRPTLP